MYNEGKQNTSEWKWNRFVEGVSGDCGGRIFYKLKHKNLKIDFKISEINKRK